MKKGAIWIAVTCLMVTSLFLASCATSTTNITTTSTTTSTAVAPITTNSTTTIQPATTTVQTTTPVPTTTGNWWDSLGKPQYGGSMVIRYDRDTGDFDPNYSVGTSMKSAWMETLTTDDWTLNPSIFNYKIGYRPVEYEKGQLAASWEFTDPSTYVVHLRQGIHWQNIAPANGREFVASDVAYHFDREYGLGGGFTKPSPTATTANTYKPLISVTATDKYTAVFKWSTSNPAYITGAIDGSGQDQMIENPEAVQQWGNLNDWHHAIGTGPFILQDFVAGSSGTLVRNPNYWGYDERYPQNQLPYVNTLDILIIPDSATAMAGLRTGKIDALSQVSLTNAQLINKTNPAILQITVPQNQAMTVDPRNDVKPFSDIRVRQAMQESLDLPTIAKNYYGGNASPDPCSMTSVYMTGYGFPYAQWPQDLKDQYAYNPTGAKQLLAAAGYPSGFNTDVVANNAADLDLLQVVKAYFTAIGINMDIRTMDPTTYSAYILARKHDQLFYNSSGSLGFTYDPIRQLNRYLTGYTANANMVSDPTFDSYAPKALAATSMDDVKQALKDANERVAEQHFTISLLQPNVYELVQPWLKGYNAQNNAIYGGSVGPTMLFFYPARFWIDQNLKKSMGY